MTVEIEAVGFNCNLNCKYCYQHPTRNLVEVSDYDFDAIKKTIEKLGREFTMFGGEPLTMPLDQLEKFWELGFKKFNKNSIQTNCLNITDKTIELMQKYNVSVGMSLDGPDELNSFRCDTTITNKIMQNVEKLLKSNLSVGLIVTLTPVNTAATSMEKFKDWFRWLDSLGLNSCRLHVLSFSNNIQRKEFYVPEDKLAEVIIELCEMKLNNLTFDRKRDILSLLQGDSCGVTCVWQGCDIYSTPSCYAVRPDGSVVNCGRAYKDGTEWLRTDEVLYDRLQALYQTPQECGGCANCKFFLMCRGQCPGTAIDDDYRNRSELCKLWKKLFAFYEKKLILDGITPITMDGNLRTMENLFIHTLGTGTMLDLKTLKDRVNNVKKIPVLPKTNTPHGDIAHGDIPHTNHEDKHHSDHNNHVNRMR